MYKKIKKIYKKYEGLLLFIYFQTCFYTLYVINIPNFILYLISNVGYIQFSKIGKF